MCGEETAMLESIEGKRGVPRHRPPYVAERGLWSHPTLVNNLETLYWVVLIAEHGAAWFRSRGLHGKSGMRFYSVSGRVNNAGVQLAPVGISVEDLIDHYCGGMPSGHSLYAFMCGGASGGLLPAQLATVPLHNESLSAYDCSLGCAAIVVLSQVDSAREAAVRTMQFFADESCGQCTPCRVGTYQAASLMQTTWWDTERLGALGHVMSDASICGLGQSAPTVMRSVMQWFSHEINMRVVT